MRGFHQTAALVKRKCLIEQSGRISRLPLSGRSGSSRTQNPLAARHWRIGLLPKRPPPALYGRDGAAIFRDHQGWKTDKRIYLWIKRIHHDIETDVSNGAVQSGKEDGQVAKRQTEIL